MVRIIILTFVIGLIFYFANFIGIAQYVHTDKWFILAFFFAISYFNHLLMKFGFANNREYFVQYYLGSIIVRLILSVGFIGIFGYLGTKDIYTFISNFFVLYLCYTSFEISGLYRKLRHIS